MWEQVFNFLYVFTQTETEVTENAEAKIDITEAEVGETRLEVQSPIAETKKVHWRHDLWTNQKSSTKHWQHPMNGSSYFDPSFTWLVSVPDEPEVFQVTSEVFLWSGYPVRAKATLKLDSDDAQLSLCFDKESIEALKAMKIIPNVYFLLKDRTGSAHPDHMYESKSQLYGGPIEFKRSLCDRSWLADPLYNVNGSVVIEVFVEPEAMAQKVYSSDGTLEWAIEECERKVREAKEGLVLRVQSPYFYTSPLGFRVQVDWELNAWGENKGLTACVTVLKGLFDDVVKPFAYRVTVTLLNRKQPYLNIKEVINGDFSKRKEMYIFMCDLKAVETLVENDTLYYEVTIKAMH